MTVSIAERQNFKKTIERRIAAINSICPEMDSNPIRYHIFRRYGNIKNPDKFKKKKEPKILKKHKHRTRVASFTFDEVREMLELPARYKKGKPYGLHDGVYFSLRRAAIIFEIGFDCVHCGLKGHIFHLEHTFNKASWHLDLYSEDDTLMTIDHLVPKSRGGPDVVENFQNLCMPCNTIKGNRHCH